MGIIGRVAITSVLGNADAFERTRVSNTDTRFDSEFQVDLQPLQFDPAGIGAGTGILNQTLRAVYLSTGGVVDGDGFWLPSNFYIPYTKGNSQLILLTGTFNPDATDFINTRTEFRYGDSFNAIGFYYEDGVAGVFIRNNGVTVDVPENSWQHPQPDVNWEFSQIFLMDFQSLRVGRVRFFLDRGGEAILVHELKNDNINIAGYWQTPNLPIVWGIRNTGVPNQANRSLAMCASVKSEGGGDLLDLPGFPFSADTGSTLKTISNVEIPVLALRMKSTFGGITNRLLSIIESVNSYAVEDDVILRIYLGGSVTGGSWVSADPNSATEYNTSATAFSGGRTVALSLVVPAGKNSPANVSSSFRRPLSLGYNGEQPELIVTAIRIGLSDASTFLGVGWREIH